MDEDARVRPPLVTPAGLGFSLVGIVMADDPALTFAIIEHQATREQRIYRQGDRTDGVLIKRVLRDEVILDAGEGDRRLQLQHAAVTVDPRASRTPERRTRVGRDVADGRPIRGRRTAVHLDRREVAPALANVNRVLEQVELSPVTRFDQPAGFRITGMPAGSILARLGLRNGDIVTRLDDAKLTHPEQAAELLRRVRQGGQLTLTVNKRRRTRHIVLNIQ